MEEHALVSLAAIVVLGIGAQWLAWRLHLPSILLLLLAGFVAGPVTGLIDPDHLLGETLFPIVSISVGIILFEGGLTLRLGEIRGVRQVIARLISVGALVTWVVGTLGAYLIVGLDFELSLLMGAIFVVSGPTVVIPLLNFVRPRGQVGSILKWEGILIDPVGATLAVLVFEVILTGQHEGPSLAAMAQGLLSTVVVGGGVGALAAVLMLTLLRRYWVPEHLQNPVAVMLVVAAFALANELQPEAGLLATTLMGLLVANQQNVPIGHLSQFKEDIGVLLLSGLFVLLAARLDLESLVQVGPRTLLYLVLLIGVARPLAVWLSTVRSSLQRRERLLLSWLAPRGIVAVAVASLFALELGRQGHAQADQIVPLTFTVVVGTVLIYGLTVARVARALGLAQPDPSGLLIVGAHGWAREIARVLHQAGHPLLLVDTNPGNISAARLSGLPAMYASILSEHVLQADLSQLGRLLALTPNDEVNSLAALRFAEIFGRACVYQLPLHGGGKSRTGVSHDQRGRCLFAEGLTFSALTQRFEAGAMVKAIKLTDVFGYPQFRERYGPQAVPLFLLNGNGALEIFSTDISLTPRAGQTLIALVDSRGTLAAPPLDTADRG